MFSPSSAIQSSALIGRGRTENVCWKVTEGLAVHMHFDVELRNILGATPNACRRTQHSLESTPSLSPQSSCMRSCRSCKVQYGVTSWRMQ